MRSWMCDIQYDFINCTPRPEEYLFHCLYENWWYDNIIWPYILTLCVFTASVNGSQRDKSFKKKNVDAGGTETHQPDYKNFQILECPQNMNLYKNHCNTGLYKYSMWAVSFKTWIHLDALFFYSINLLVPPTISWHIPVQLDFVADKLPWFYTFSWILAIQN